MTIEYHTVKSFTVLIVSFIGIIGNFAAFLVYRTPQMRKSTVGTLLLLVSIIDVILLALSVHLFSIIALPIWPGVNEANSTHSMVSSISSCYVYPFCMMAKSCSLYFLVLITIERWIAVCRPLQAKILCTNRNTLRAGIIIVIFSIIFNIPKFFDYTYTNDYRWQLWMLDSDQHHWYFLTYYGISSVLFDYLIPVMIMLISNFYVVRELRRNDETITTMNVQKRKEKNTTVMLLVVTIYFAVCHSVGGVLKIIECICGTFMTTKPHSPSHTFWIVFADLTVFLIIFHTSSTFFLYYAFSEKFRTIFWAVLRCRNNFNDENTKLSMFYPSAQTSMIIDTKRKITHKENFL